MNPIQQTIDELQSQYRILGIIDLDLCHDIETYKISNYLRGVLFPMYKPRYEKDERILFTLTRGDFYLSENDPLGQIMSNLQKRLNEIDISNYFVSILTTDSDMIFSYDRHFQNISNNPVPVSMILCDPVSTGRKIKIADQPYNYNSRAPINIRLKDISIEHQDLLTKNPSFCMYPWLHLHAFPTGQAYPCCQADMQFPLGNLRHNTIKEIWNQAPMRKMRLDMLAGRSVEACMRCYEQESNGFMSGRTSANKHHGHHVGLVDQTQTDGTLDEFKLVYWDVRFSNLCNLSCRSCGHIFSSSWYQDQTKLAGPEWAKKNQVLNYAGRYETDAWDQLVEHIDHVEQIYFAGGEPLMMDEHYRILEELERRERFDVRLIYNTNFTHMKLKNRMVFDYWRKFHSVSVGASLDAMGDKAEYIRKGTKWHQVEENRRQMQQICPAVDFYISPTLSIMNAWHLSDFHRDWVERGLICPQDLNVNILQDPAHYRIDIAPIKYKQRLRMKWEEHLAWLRDQDPLQRATVGFESAIRFMMATDNTHLIDNFWRRTHQLDDIRNERLLSVLPELEALL